MGEFKCPQCGNQVQAESPYGLVCPRCRYGASDPGAPRGPTYAPPAFGAPTGQGMMQGSGPLCPRCGSTYTKKGGIPTWAVVVTILGFFVVCLFSLLFLLVKDENQCYNCGLRWK